MKVRNIAIRDTFLDEIECAVSYGWHRAYKHQESPTENDIKHCISEAVHSCIFEWIDFEIEEY